MSESVKEFFSKEGIKKFKSGVKAFSSRQAVKVAAASMVLASAFAVSAHANTYNPVKDKTVTAYAITEKGDTLCSYQALKKDSVSFARLQELVNNATDSKTGCSVLEKISEQGTVLYTDYAGKGVIGFFDPNTNSICLNSAFKDADLQSCLIHEGKHSVQSHALNEKTDLFHTFASNIMTTRVMEADAMAAQTKFSYEMAQAGDSLAWKQLADTHAGITKAFEEGAKKHGQNSNEAMKETMLAWYKDTDYVTQYDNSILQFHARVVLGASENLMKQAFTQTASADSLLKYVCTVDGKPYAGTDGSILKTSSTAYLAENLCKSAEMVGKAASVRGNQDTSVNGFYVLKFDGSVSDKTYGQIKAEKDKQNGQKVIQEQSEKSFKIASTLSRNGR